MFAGIVRLAADMDQTTENASNIRRAAVAGRFYPAHPRELREQVSALLANCPRAGGVIPKAIIVPHAGYIYSGPIAASAYALWISARNDTRRVVLLGPSHFVGFEGIAASSAEAFVTPLGVVPVDRQALRLVCALPQMRVLDEAHELEHALEVQLPFLQVILADFQIVPLVVGSARTEEIAEVLERFWDDAGTRFVISSDLSHYLEWEQARALDEQTAGAIAQLKPEAIAEDQACGRLPIKGLLQAAARRGVHARTVDLRNSGDTAGPRQQVVGYGAFAFEEPQAAR